MQQPSTPSTSQSNLGQSNPGQSSTTGQTGQSTFSGQTGQSTTSHATGELKADAQQLRSKAADRLHSEVDNRKGEAVSQAQTVSSAIRQTADGLDENTPAWLKSALSQGAQKIQQFADTIEQKDSRQLMREAQDFARNNPGTFLAACAAAGFAAARIFKAGEQQGSQLRQSGQSGQFGQGQFGQSEFERSQPWGSGERDAFGQDELMDDTLGQGQRSASDASSQAFMARPETQSSTSDAFRGQDEDRITSPGDFR